MEEHSAVAQSFVRAKSVPLVRRVQAHRAVYGELLGGGGLARLRACLDEGLHGRHLQLPAAHWRAGRAEAELHQVDCELDERGATQLHRAMMSTPRPSSGHFFEETHGFSKD